MAVTRVSTDGLADSAVNSAKIGVDVITDADLANNSVTVNEISDNAVTTTKLANNAITDAKIANSTLDLTTKVTGALPVANGGTALTSGFINGGIIQSSAVSTTGAANFNITGIPAHAQKIIVNLYAVKPAASGTSRYLEMRLIDESGNQVNTTTHFNHQNYNNHNAATYTSYSNAVNSFRLDGWTAAANTWYGTLYLEYYTGFGNNTWQLKGKLWNSGYTAYGPVNWSGFCSGAGANPSGIRLMTSTGGNFDSGQFTVSYL